MKDQHEKITGYRDLSQKEIDLMNRCKQLAKECGELVNELDRIVEFDAQGQRLIDKRWLNIGRTHLQQGWMAAVRSIARPTTF